jgi:hypothetical protein
VNAAVLPGTVLGDALNATVVDSANASFLNAAQSPGLQFSGTVPRHEHRVVVGVNVSLSCGVTARKVPLSKGAKYTNSVHHSLTPSPTKFGSGGLRSPDRTTVAGVASASRATAEAASMRAVNFGEDRPLSEKYASGSAHEDYKDHNSGSQRVPESPPPPPPRGTKPDSAKWGALTESLRRQVCDFHCAHIFPVLSFNTIFILQEEDSAKPKYSSTHMPPEPFAVDASLATARSATNRKLGVSARDAAESTMQYAKELDRYIQVIQARVPFRN